MSLEGQYLSGQADESEVASFFYKNSKFLEELIEIVNAPIGPFLSSMCSEFILDGENLILAKYDQRWRKSDIMYKPSFIDSKKDILRTANMLTELSLLIEA